MAGTDKRFSLISVDDDDDDVVIHAGVASDAKEDADSPSAGRQAARSGAGEGPAAADEPDGEGSSAPAADDGKNGMASDGAAASDGQGASEAGQDAEDAEDAAFQRAMERRRREREKNRMVTTEEDLHTPVPFAGMRIAIIVAGVVAVVAILVLHSNGML